ncbi:MAG: hypothetical protein ABIF77_00465 [bacterium]
MSLIDWLANRWLVEHQTYSTEINSLLALADRDLHDAQSQQLSVDWKFNIAYNAAMQLAGAALAAAGYRVTRSGGHHHRSIQSLAHTIGADDNLVRLLERFRKKRNVAEYDSVGTISDQEVDEMIDLAQMLRKQVEEWLHRTHPALLANRDPDS